MVQAERKGLQEGDVVAQDILRMVLGMQIHAGNRKGESVNWGSLQQGL